MSLDIEILDGMLEYTDMDDLAIDLQEHVQMWARILMWCSDDATDQIAEAMNSQQMKVLLERLKVREPRSIQ